MSIAVQTSNAAQNKLNSGPPSTNTPLTGPRWAVDAPEELC